MFWILGPPSSCRLERPAGKKMSVRRTAFGISILVLMALAIAFVGWEVYTVSSDQFCTACEREIQSTSRTVGLAEGRKQVFCCPTCVIRQHIQTGTAARIVEFSDFDTGDSLRPDDAYLVEGSGLNYCLRGHTHMDENKQAGRLDFDRCSPSIFAFETRTKALRFQREHGGDVLRSDRLGR